MLWFGLIAACGASPSAVDDAGPDANADASADSGFDAAAPDGQPCTRDADCGPRVADRVCEPNGVCGPSSCSTLRGHACPESLWCVLNRCVLPSCDACPEGMVCSPADGECVPPADPVACRAGGGLFVRDRCLRPGEEQAACDGGFGADLIGSFCDVPLVPERMLHGLFLDGAFPIARVTEPVPGTLVASRSPVPGSTPVAWRFAYVDGADAAYVSLELSAPIVDHRAYGCIAPSTLRRPPADLCGLVSVDSAFACGGLRVEAMRVLPARAGDQTHLALAGRNDAGRLHLETLLDVDGRYALEAAYTTRSASRVWPPLSFAPYGFGSLWFRTGLAPPLGLARLDPGGVEQEWTEAGLAGGEEFSAWTDSLALGRAASGKLGLFSLDPDLGMQTLLAAAETPVGRYHAFVPMSGVGSFVAHASLPLPSTLETYEVDRSSAGSPSVTRVSEEPNVGLYTGAAFAALQPDGSYLLQGGLGAGDPGLLTLIGPEDVGGEILAIDDLTQWLQPEQCGLDFGSVGFVLVGAMLEIRLADGSVVRELWAVGVKA